MNANAMLAKELAAVLECAGAVLTGVGALHALPEAAREGLSIGVSVAVVYPREVITGIANGPTAEYFRYYNSLNDQLDAIVQAGAAFLMQRGYRAVACTRAQVGTYGETLLTRLPHKTVATRAGLGWIGKCALLVTKEYGSMVRISSLLTDAPLPTAAPIDAARCGKCAACVDACPAHAANGIPWEAAMKRERFFDATACYNTARKRTMERLGLEATLCGKCIEVCPYTRRYLNA